MQYKVALYLDFSAGSRVSCIVSIVRDLIRKKDCPDRHLSLVHYCVSLASVLPPKRNKPNAIFVLIVLGNLRKAILTFHLSHINAASDKGLIASQIRLRRRNKNCSMQGYSPSVKRRTDGRRKYSASGAGAEKQ